MKATPFEVKERHREQLSGLSNVVGVGVGAKIVKGQPTGAMAIKVYVSRKIAKDQLEEGQCVPKEIEGIPTDVEVMDQARAY